MADSQTIAKTIKSGRRRVGLSQARAAADVGVQRLQWIRWERGENVPSEDNRPRVAAILGIAEAAITPDDDPADDPLTRAIRSLVEREVERALRNAVASV